MRCSAGLDLCGVEKRFKQSCNLSFTWGQGWFIKPSWSSSRAYSQIVVWSFVGEYCSSYLYLPLHSGCDPNSWSFVLWDCTSFARGEFAACVYFFIHIFSVAATAGTGCGFHRCILRLGFSWEMCQYLSHIRIGELHFSRPHVNME